MSWHLSFIKLKHYKNDRKRLRVLLQLKITVAKCCKTFYGGFYIFLVVYNNLVFEQGYRPTQMRSTL
jgi:hypothetical protein